MEVIPGQYRFPWVSGRQPPCEEARWIFPASLRTFQQENLKCRNCTDDRLHLTFMYAAQYVMCSHPKTNLNLVLKMKWGRKSVFFSFPVSYAVPFQ